MIPLSGILSQGFKETENRDRKSSKINNGAAAFSAVPVFMRGENNGIGSAAGVCKGN